MTIEQFYIEVGGLLAKYPEWRYGQALYNHLHDVRPDLSQQIWGTDKDPFFFNKPIDEKVVNFNKFIQDNW